MTACFDICAVVTTSGQSPHPFHCHHIADLRSYTSSRELPKCPQTANLWVAQCLEFIPSLPRFLPILFYFVFSKLAHNQNFSEANLS
jgi:hypothetical protein